MIETPFYLYRSRITKVPDEILLEDVVFYNY